MCFKVTQILQAGVASIGGAGAGGGAGGGGEDEEGELSNVVHIGSLPSIAGGTLWEAIKV